MRFARYQSQTGPRIGLETPDGVFDTGYDDLATLIGDGEKGIGQALEAQRAGRFLKTGRLLAPLVPRTIYLAGINYRGHLRENPAYVIPDEPLVTAIKPSSTIIGPDEPIVLPASGTIARPDGFEVGHEVELAVIVGKRARNVSVEDAPGHIFGYTLINDVTARAIFARNGQMTLAKSFDSFAPIGPRVVTTDEIGDVTSLRLRSRINDLPMQDGAVGDQIHGPAALLSWISAFATLLPGDCIATGAPPGTAFFSPEPRWLRAGDVVTCSEERIGVLSNPVIAAEINR